MVYIHRSPKMDPERFSTEKLCSCLAHIKVIMELGLGSFSPGRQVAQLQCNKMAKSDIEPISANPLAMAVIKISLVTLYVHIRIVFN